MDRKRMTTTTSKGQKYYARRGVALLLVLVLVLSLPTATAFSQSGDGPVPADDAPLVTYGDPAPTPLLGEGESIASVAAPAPSAYTVDKGTAIDSIGLPATLQVVINTGSDPATRTEQADVTWSGTYTPDTEGSYTLTASFADTAVTYGGTMPSVTVTVKANATLLARLASLPTVADAAAMSDTEKQALRAKLVDIATALNALDAAGKAAVEAEVGASQMALFNELHGIYAAPIGGVKDTLDEDWVYISRASIVSVKDGAGPFDKGEDVNAIDYKNRQGNDENDSNGVVRSFDTVTYDISYQTMMSGEYDNVAAGYMCYEFALPYTVDKAMMDTGAMPWMGPKYTSLDAVPAATSGYIVTTGTRTINGVEQECQIVTGKRWMTGTDTNPYAFPGNGTLSAVVQVLAMKQDDVAQPQFTLWMDHNATDGACVGHSRTEPKIVLPDPVKVTAELRLNVKLKSVSTSYVNRLGNFDFSTGNDDALNRTSGTVYGRLQAYGVTLQLYNQDANKALKGCALPEGEITFDVNFSSSYVKTADTENPILLDGQAKYTPLVWSYEPNKSGSTQKDGRDVKSFGSSYAVAAAPGNGTYTGVFKTSPATGVNYCWNGGKWKAEQNDGTVSFTVSDYVINPNWLPNTDAGNSAHYTTYFNPTQGVRSTHIGGFSAGELFMIIPFGGDGSTTHEDYLAKKYGAGNVALTVTDVNLRATSEHGEALATVTDNTNQQYLSDDKVASTVALAMSGYISSIINYTYATDRNTDVNGTTECRYNGQDAAFVGQNLAILWGEGYNAYSEPHNVIYGFNSLMKFDDTALELTGAAVDYTGTYGSSAKDPTAVATFLYAAKQDGTGWRGAKDENGEYALSEAQGDAAMNAAVEGDLVYYPTLAALEADGKVCVGMLREERTSNPALLETVNALTTVPCRVKNDYALSGGVYQIRISNTYWRQSAYDTAKTAAGGGADYTIPSRLTVQNTPGATMPAATVTDYKQNYVKAWYDDSGYAGGHSGRANIGDSLYVTPYKCTITKAVAQKITGTDTLMSSYDMDFDQRVADYVLYPKTETTVTVTGNSTTRVTIVDTLPKWLTFIPDSAYQGGTYQQNAEVGRQGTVTGGTELPPESSVKNGDGTTTVTWVLDDVPIGQEIEPIYYSCEIGHKGAVDDVPNGTDLENSVVISATEDHRAVSVGNGNIATESITVSRLFAASLSKVADSTYYEAGQPIGWTLHCGNNGANDIPGAMMLDTMPANGDAAGSRFSATLKVTEWKIDPTTTTNMAGWVCYYTESASAKGLQSSDYLAAYTDPDWEGTEAQKLALAADAMRTAITGLSTKVNGKTATWKTAAIDENGNIADLVGKSPTAVAVVGTLKTLETYVAHVTVEADENGEAFKSGDKLVNSLSQMNDSVESASYVVYRTLEGLTWFDANKDGQRDSAEAMLPGVTATLLKLKEGGNAANEDDYEPYQFNSADVKVQTGKQMDLITGEEKNYESGRYMFTSLPAGTFAVRFTDGTVELNKYVATTDNSGSDYTDSDAIATDNADAELVSGFIGNLVMPTLDKMGSYLYESKYNDMGVYFGIPTPIEETPAGTKTLTQNGTNKAITAGQFSFSIAAADSNDATGYTGFTPGSADVKANGTFTFSEITFTKVGSYSFTITEQDKGAAGYTYDADAVTVTYVIKLNETDNTLYVDDEDTTYTKDGAEADAITFANTYAPTPAKGGMQVEKVVTGEPATASDFTFVLKAKDAASPMPEESTAGVKEVTRTGEGSVEFGDITFLAAGTYEYTVTEKNTGVANYTYDTTTYTVTYEVTDTNAVLGVIRTIELQGNIVEEAKFTNKFEIPPVPEVRNGPKTDDNTNPGLWTVLMVMSVIGVCGCVLIGKKKRRAE